MNRYKLDKNISFTLNSLSIFFISRIRKSFLICYKLTFCLFRAFVLSKTTTNLILLSDDEEKVQPFYGLERIKNKGNLKMLYPLKSRMYYIVNTK
jgi:hypothetical protein